MQLNKQEIKFLDDHFNDIYYLLEVENMTIEGQKIFQSIQNKLLPIYETLPGWQTSTFAITRWKDLPKNAQKYIDFLESKIEKNISIISTGPDRIHTIDRNNLLSNN